MMTRVLTALLTAAALLLAGPLMAFDINSMSDEERAAFHDEVRRYILENPEIITEAVQVLEERRALAQAAADDALVMDHAARIFDDGFSFVGGNPEGDITLVEFLDYRCGFCKRAHGEVAKLLESDGNIRLIVKELPILGEQSVLASRFAVATKQVAGDAAYKTMSDALMEFNGDISVVSLRRLAETFGFDADAIEAAMESDEVNKVLSETRALAQALQINGTPTFVLQDEMLRGYLPFDQMMELVSEKRG